MLRSCVSLLCFLTALSSDAGAPAREPLPFFYDLYTFRGAGRSTAVVAAFAVPAGRLREEELPKGVRYRFDVTLVLADTARRTVSRTDDSVFVHLRRPLRAEHVLVTQLEVEARPSRTTVQRVIMTDATSPGTGQLYDSHYPIPDYTGSGLMLSDIALGLPGGSGGWKRGEVTLALLPTSEFPGSAFDVYYEVYNLPDDRRYATEIAVHPIGAHAGDARPVRVRFSGHAEVRPDGTMPELRRVDASLAEGRYRIAVTVTDELTGESTTRSREVHVRGWQRGATVVPALPRGRTHTR